jgi:hypothetical protein
MENFGSWSVLTTNYLILLYLALGGITLSAVLHLCNGQWRFQVRKLACSFAVLFPICGVLLLILLFNGENTFQWLAHAHDADHHLPGWHDYGFLVTRQIVGFLFVASLCGLFIRYQHQSEIDTTYRVRRRFRNIALLIPFVYFIYGSMVAWDFEMTMWPNWHSASYGAYHFQSNFHMFLAFFTIFLFVLHRSGRLTQPFEFKIFNYMAQFMLAMTILWTYLFFTQYLVMWYGRMPEEMARYNNMMLAGLGGIWWTFLACKFVIPLLTLVFTKSRQNPVVITTVAVLIVFGTWLERYTWISGTVDPVYYHIPMTSMFDIIVTIGLFGLAAWAVQRTLVRYGLVRAS